MSVVSDGEKAGPRGRIYLAEPATAVTDWIIAAACGHFAVSLAAAGVTVEWPLAFALSGASALVGGIVHALPESAGSGARGVLWSLTLLLFGASAAAFGAGAIGVARPDVDSLAVRLACATAFGIYVVAVLQKPEFASAGRMALLMLATFVAMGLSLALRGEPRAAALVLAAVSANGVGIVIQLRRLAPHARFNHNDLFHVFQLVALWCLYLSVNHAR